MRFSVEANRSKHLKISKTAVLIRRLASTEKYRYKHKKQMKPKENVLIESNKRRSKQYEFEIQLLFFGLVP